MSYETLITSTPQVDGYQIKKNFGLTTADVAIREKAMKSLTIGFMEGLGKRSEKMKSAYDEVREKCLTLLDKKAQAAGANAIVNVCIQVVPCGPRNHAMLMTGTMVHCERVTNLDSINVPETTTPEPLVTTPVSVASLTEPVQPVPSNNLPDHMKGIDINAIRERQVTPSEVTSQDVTRNEQAHRDQLLQRQELAASALCASDRA